tara:strand:- start:46 stop:312 length:267 start_codon:yes stop_codon:yes gene_type:complete
MEKIKMNDYFMKEIEEIHEYLFNKDGMRLGQRMKKHQDLKATEISNKLDNLENKIDEIEKAFKPKNVLLSLTSIMLACIVGLTLIFLF